MIYRASHELKVGPKVKGRNLLRTLPFYIASLLIVGLACLTAIFSIPRHSLATGQTGCITGDATVDSSDLTALIDAWGTSSASADLNGDGTVNVLDLSILLSNWDKSCGAGGSLITTANVWVSPSGSDSGSSCTRSATPVPAPSASTVCASLEQAYSLADGGDTVGIMGGTYSAPQTILFDGTKADSNAGLVTFDVVSGPAIIPAINLGLNTGNAGGNSPNYISFNGQTADGLVITGTSSPPDDGGGDFYLWYNTSPGTHITVNDADFTDLTPGESGGGSQMSLDSPNYFTVTNSDFGGSCCNAWGLTINAANGSAQSANVSLDHDHFANIQGGAGDSLAYDCATVANTWPGGLAGCENNGCGNGGGCVNTGVHPDCMLTQAITNFTVTNSTFYNCPFAIETGDQWAEAGQVWNGITLENDLFGPYYSDGSLGTAFDLGLGGPGDYPAVEGSTLMENDTFEGAVNLENVQSGSSVEETNDIFDFPANCQTTTSGGFSNVITIDDNYNLWMSGSCNSTDTSGSANFISATQGSENLGLATGSNPPVDVGDPNAYIPTDIFGKSRPTCDGVTTNTRPDIGAAEQC